MVEFSQSTGPHGNQNEKEDERPQNLHNKPHLEQKENANIIPRDEACLNHHAYKNGGTVTPFNVLIAMKF